MQFAFAILMGFLVAINDVAATCAQEPEPLSKRDSVRFIGGLIRTIREQHVASPEFHEFYPNLIRHMAKHHAADIPQDELLQLVSSPVNSVDDVEQNLLKLPLQERLKPEFFSNMHQAVFEPLPGVGNWISIHDDKIEKQLMANQYVGVGISIEMDSETGRPKLLRVFDRGTAHQAGMKPAEIIVSVDGHDTKDQKIVDIITWLRGPAESQVEIVLRSPDSDSLRTLRVPRRVIPLPTVEVKKVQDNFVLIHFDRIAASCVHELRSIHSSLQNSSQTIVLDLREVRDDGLHFAHMLLDSLLDAKSVGYVVTKKGTRELESEEDRLFANHRLIVVVSPNSSNCAQWVAQVLGENGARVLFDTENDENRFSEYPQIADRKRVAFAHELISLPNEGGAVWLATAKILSIDRKPIWVVESKNPIKMRSASSADVENALELFLMKSLTRNAQ